ncbi:hypothetical protein JK636_22330 [Clostridium sp. YIM B02515]|uniref:ABC transmembrane type-1 domain-containing protein n=1 Tax=Clostridium rhizosphaerae TaxID=2803861 RepID=A0ABS1TGL2_9CLOT|nr:hypothetical protein [Clostridium rhizosphaerae]MBL4938450.1 hypothetical protein [Clostridium rhizosphaerae]
MRWILWPFKMIFNLVTSIVKITGRLVSVILGLVILILGGAITMTIVGAIVGVPLCIFGVMLMIRGFF